MIRFALGFLGVITLAAAPLSAQDTADARQFAASILELIKSEVPAITAASEPGEPLQINVTDHPVWDEATINLHRIYGFCQTASEEECVEQISRLLAALAEEQTDFTPANLRIVVRDLEYWTYISSTMPDEDVPHHKVIGDDLVAILVLDSPDAIALAPPQDIAEMELSVAEAWEIAAAQTAEAIPQLPVEDASLIADGIAAFQGDEYTASLLFDLERWAQISAAIGPEMMVAPISDQIVIASAAPTVVADLDGFKALAAEECSLAARCVSPNVFHFRDGMWVSIP